MPADPDDDPVDAEVVQELAGRVSALVIHNVEQQIDQKIEHLHVPMAMPSAEEAAALKERAPEAYELWLKLAEKKADDDAALARLPFDYPFSLAKRGQWFGVFGLVAVLGFCAYLASLGGTVRWLAGIIAAIDLVAIIAVFMSGSDAAPVVAAAREAVPRPDDEQSTPGGDGNST